MALIGRKRGKRGYRSVALGCSLASVCAVLACEEPSSQAVAPTTVATPVAPPAADGPLYDPSAFRHHRLDNGLAMILFENPSMPTVSLGFQARRSAGSVDPKHAGLARFTAIVMNQGAGARDRRALLKAVRDQSGVLEISTGWDAIAVEIEGPADNIDSLIAILADVVMRPQLEDEQAQLLGSLLLANMQKSRDRPNDLQQRFADRVLYPNHRAGLPLEGTEETLAALTAKDARDFHSQVFVPNNLTFFALGSFDADDLLARVTEAFGSWAPGPVPPQPLPHPSPAPETQRVLLVDRPGVINTSLVLLAHDGISRRSPDRAAAHLLNEAITQRALLMVHGENRVNRGGGSYRLSAVTHWSKVRRVIDLLLGELEQLRTQKIPEPEFEKLRTRLLTRFSKSLSSPKSAFFRVLSVDLYEMPEDSIEEYRSWIRDTTPEALRQKAQRLLHPDRAAIIVVGPAERLLPLLEGLGPIEVVPFVPASDRTAGPSVRTDSLPPE